MKQLNAKHGASGKDDECLKTGSGAGSRLMQSSEGGGGFVSSDGTWTRTITPNDRPYLTRYLYDEAVERDENKSNNRRF